MTYQKHSGLGCFVWCFFFLGGVLVETLCNHDGGSNGDSDGSSDGDVESDQGDLPTSPTKGITESLPLDSNPSQFTD